METEKKPELQKATTLEMAARNFQPSALLTDEEIRVFYREDLNDVRYGDEIRLMERLLELAHGNASYKTFLMGHSGIGKSTELTRMFQRIGDRFQHIRLSVLTDLNPSTFEPLDVLLLMVVEIIERTAKPIVEGGAGARPSDRLLEDAMRWFASEKTTDTVQSDIGAQASAGLGLTSDSLWAKALGLFGSIKGEMKFNATRQETVVQYRLTRLSSLVELANRLLDECNWLLKQATGKEWVFVWEDFEKLGQYAEKKVETLFLDFAPALKGLRTHLISTISTSLGYSRAAELPFDRRHLRGIPVFFSDHREHARGRASLKAVLDARMDLSLFEEGQVERVIVASGGDLRDLFRLVTLASVHADIDKEKKIRILHVDKAMNNLRRDYFQRIGSSNEDSITGEQQLKRLIRIYCQDPQDPTANTHDMVLAMLFRLQTVQEFANGDVWLCVHPLVVDNLHRQFPEKIKKDSKYGVLPGGTE